MEKKKKRSTAKLKKQPMVVTISGERPIHEVASDLKAAGFDVGQVLQFTGTVTGSADAKVAKKLRGIAGVADVSDDHPVNIGPPDSLVS